MAVLIEAYLSEHTAAAVLEDGRVLFDLRAARYSVDGAGGRCVLQLWSEERNIVRTVIGVERRSICLRVMTRKLGAPKPVSLELVPTSDRRTPNTRDAGRRQYLRLLERVLARRFPDWELNGLSAATDLENSFGPAFARGRLFCGRSAEAVIGVGSEESSSAIEGVLTLGLLWLDHCLERSAGGRSDQSGRGKNGLGKAGRSGLGGSAAPRHFGGLKVIVPPGTWRTTAERMAWLNQNLAGFTLFTLDQRSEDLTPIDFNDCGNVHSRLVHAFDAEAAIDRAQAGIARVMSVVDSLGASPGLVRQRVEVRAGSAAEVGLLLNGLEFARVRNAAAIHSFAPVEEISFGAGANETLLSDESEPLCRQLLERLFVSRQPAGIHTDPLFRLQPERWLESRIRLAIDEMSPGLRREFLYTQVPAIGAGERGMLDLLTVDRDGRLTVIEVKADEDMHLPLQGLDYWIRVRALNADRKPKGNRNAGEFERRGYFAHAGVSAEISERDPKLMLIAPALRIHPSNEIVLRYLSPQVDWELIAVGEHWRRDLKVVFRKRSGG